MRKLLLLAALCLPLAAQTAINDTLYLQGATPWTGQIVVSWPAFTNCAGAQIAKGSRVSPVNAGAVAISLWATDCASPSFAYSATYKTMGGANSGLSWSETWAIPSSPSIVTLGAVRRSSTLKFFPSQIIAAGLNDGAYCINVASEAATGLVACSGGGGSSAWADITGKPSTFAPSAHASTHASGGSDPVTLAESQVTGLTSDLSGKASASALSTHVADMSNPHSVTKAQIGLGSVDNTADSAKPVSTATQTALDAKAPLASPSFTGTVSISGTALRGGGTSLPATCSVGDQYFLTTGTTGNYQCTATNTWTLPGGSGGGGGIDRYWAPQTNGVVPSSPLSLPAANYPAVDAVIGTNIVYGVWSFAPGSDQSMYGSLPIPTSVPSSIVFEVRWRTADTTTSHTVSLQALYLCNATGADSAMTSAGTASGNPPSSQYQWTTSTITLSSPSCSAGDTMFFKIVNKGATATATSNIEVASIRIRG